MSENKTEIAPATEDLLKTLDMIMVIDHSGSMAEPSNRLKGRTRYEEVAEQVLLAARIAEKYDEDGLTMVHFSSKAVVTDGCKADTVKEIFAKHGPGGSTALDLALIEVEKKAKASSKEVVAFIFTDGEANDPQAVINVINRMGKDLGRPKVGLCIIQVGSDARAKAFLSKLDNDLTVDICAVFSEEEAENLSIEQLATAARTE